MKPQGYERNRTQLFFAYFMDCQTPAKPGGGPNLTWEMAEIAVRGIAELFSDRGLAHCLGLCSEPEVARRQPDLFAEAAQAGCWQALHFQARAYRPPGATEDLPWDKPMAAYGYDEQLGLLRIATDDWEQSLGWKAETFGACCAQANDYTHPILAELGYRQCYTSVPGRYNPEAHQRWWGEYPHSRHCSSKSRLIPGELDLYEVPHTHDLDPKPGSAPGTWHVTDYRAEHEMSFAETVAMATASIQDMLRRDHPLLYLYAPTHNTWDVGDRSSGRRRAIDTAIDVAHAVAEDFSLELTPASLPEFHAEADRLNAY
jgi:hypothetical protein